MNAQWMSVLRGCSTAVELGCGFGVVLKKLVARGIQAHGVDIFGPYLDCIPTVAPGATWELEDALAWCQRQPSDSYDAVLAIDFIEHVDYDDGLDIIAHAQRIARVGVIIETPHGYVAQDAEEAFHIGTPGVPDMLNPWQAHVSGWTVNDLVAQGFLCNVKMGNRGYDRLCATWHR